METNKSNSEKFRENILIRLDREVVTSKLLDEKANDEFIKELEEQWIELMKKSLEKYQ